MRLRHIFCSIFLFCSLSASAIPLQSRSVRPYGDGLRVSILTVGVGQDLYASFGHTGIRIIDSAMGSDMVYNYGTFYNAPHFYWQFTMGRMLYYIDKCSFRQFMSEYVVEKRIVQEQVLDLPDSDKRKIQTYLETNLLPQNRAYYYNFLFDNCATRVRDVFPRVLGQSFHFGPILAGQKESFRDVINHYLAQKHWERFGINLLLGKSVDALMTDKSAMFLPDYLHEGLKGATFNGKPLVASSKYLLTKATQSVHPLDAPLWMNIGIFILTALCFQAPAFKYLKNFIRFLLLFVSGLLGCFMLFMWLGTAHIACSQNFNILWALPTNILIAFVALKKRGWLKYYSIAAFVLMLTALIFHICDIQKLPLFELIPFLFCLLYVYIDIWKQKPEKNSDKAVSSV